MKKLSYIGNRKNTGIYRILSVLFACCFFSQGALGSSSIRPEDAGLPNGLSFVSEEGGYKVVSGNDGMGLVSEKGEIIIPARYGRVDSVGESLFVTQKYREDSTNECTLFDIHGRKVCNLPDWTRIDGRHYHEGLLNIAEPYSGAIFVDKQGSVVLKCDKFSQVKDFSSGMAAVYYNDRDGDWSGFIDHEGKLVLGPFKDLCVESFEDGLAIVSKYLPDKTSVWGVINTSGKYVLPLEYSRLNQYSKKRFLVKKGTAFKFLDQAGKILIDFPKDCTDIYLPDSIEPDTLIPCGFGGTVPRNKFRGNVGSKWGYCDTTGKLRLEPKFSFCMPFSGNTADVLIIDEENEEQVTGIIDRKGEWVQKPVDKSLKDFESAGWHRSDVFLKLLSENNLIGMDIEQIAKLFGKTAPAAVYSNSTNYKQVSYSLTPGAHCGNACITLQFRFASDNRVDAWRVIYGGMPDYSNPWITENVVAEYKDKGLQIGNLIPKK